MIKRTILSAALALALGVTLGIWWQAGTEVHSESEDEADAAVYRCPMHPAVVADHPGTCPVCGMDMVADAPEAAGDVQALIAALDVDGMCSYCRQVDA